MRTLLFLSLIFLFKLNDCYAQNTKINSLQNLLRIAKEDTNKVNILYEISEECAEEDILKYAVPALQLAEKLNYKKGIADASNNIGYAYGGLGNLSQALEYYHKSLKIREDIGDKEGIAGSLNNIAVVYNNQGDVIKALEYHEKSLKAQEDIGNKEGIATSLNNIGFIYKNQGNTPKALDYYFKSLKIYEEIGNKQGIATSYNNVSALYESQGDFRMAFQYDRKGLKVSEEAGNKYGIARALNNIGLYYSHQGNIPEAFEYYQKSLRLYEEIGTKSPRSTLLKNIGQLYELQGNFSKASEYYTKSLTIQEEVGDKRLIAAILSDLGNIQLKQKKYKQAAAYCSQSLQIGQDIGNPQIISDASENLSEIYSALGKYKEAYRMHVLFKQMSDSVSNVETRKLTVKKEMQYDFDKKEAALKAEHEKKDALAAAEIKRQTVIRNFTFAAACLAAIFSFFLIRSFNRRKKIAFDMQVSEVEMKALRSQMNPHFIFNSLYSIKKYVLENNGENASRYLSKFSDLMRLILENSREQEVPLEKDLAALELYMQLEALRFQNRFQYIIQIDSQIDKENTLIPPLLLQPFVENSIIHGLPGVERGLIKISVSKEGNMIRCIVEDYGIGRKQSVKVESGEEKKRESLGIKITEERLHIINHLKNSKTDINILDLNDEENQMSGLRVELLLPFEEAF